MQYLREGIQDYITQKMTAENRHSLYGELITDIVHDEKSTMLTETLGELSWNYYLAKDQNSDVNGEHNVVDRISRCY